MATLKLPTGREHTSFTQVLVMLCFLMGVGLLFLALGFLWSAQAHAAEKGDKKEPRVVYPKKTNLDFDGLGIEGELKSPGEFYFKYRPSEKFDSLVKRRKNFHTQMLRDAVLTR